MWRRFEEIWSSIINVISKIKMDKDLIKRLDNQELALEEMKDSIGDLRTFMRNTISNKIDESITAVDHSIPEMLKRTLENIKLIERNLNSLGSMTVSLMQQNQELTSNLAALARKYVCVSKSNGTRCVATNVMIYFCNNCDKSFPVCHEHVKQNRKRNLCSVCGQSNMTRRFAIPFPEQECNYKLETSQI